MLLALLKTAFEYLPPFWKQKVCGYLAPGHTFTMEMIRMADSSYLLDPLTECRHCGVALPERIYERLVTEIDANEDEYDDEIEDEVW